MNKKDVLTVEQMPLNVLGGLRYRNSGFNVCGVIEHLSGSYNPTVSCGDSTGSSYGLQRAALSGGYASFQAIVLPHSVALRITGLNKYPRNKSTIPVSGMWFTMLPIFIRTGVS